MEKSIVIDGKEVRFKSTAGTPVRYKAQFGKDYLSEILKLNAIKKINVKQSKGEQLTAEDFNSLDFDVFYEIAWTMAKTADPSISDPITWLDGFDEFPMIDIIPELQDLIASTLKSKKK